MPKIIVSYNCIYFATTCTQDRENLFGTIVNNQTEVARLLLIFNDQ